MVDENNIKKTEIVKSIKKLIRLRLVVFKKYMLFILFNKVYGSNIEALLLTSL